MSDPDPSPAALSTPPPLPPPFPAPAHTVLAFPIACVQCDYNLEGLEISGVCPECGTPIARSASGDLLVFSPRDAVERVSAGVRDVVAGLTLFLVAAALITIFAMLLVALVPMSSRPELERPARIVLGVLGLIVLTLAIIRHARGWLALSHPVHPPTELVPSDPALPILRLLTIVLSAILWLLLMTFFYLQTLAFPSRSIDSAAGKLAILLGVVTAVALGAFWSPACLVLRGLLIKVPLPSHAAKLKPITWTMLPAIGLALLGVSGVSSRLLPLSLLVSCMLAPAAGIWMLICISRAIDALLTLARVLPRIVQAKASWTAARAD